MWKVPYVKNTFIRDYLVSCWWMICKYSKSLLTKILKHKDIKVWVKIWIQAIMLKHAILSYTIICVTVNVDAISLFFSVSLFSIIMHTLSQFTRGDTTTTASSCFVPGRTYQRGVAGLQSSSLNLSVVQHLSLLLYCGWELIDQCIDQGVEWVEQVTCSLVA